MVSAARPLRGWAGGGGPRVSNFLLLILLCNPLSSTSWPLPPNTPTPLSTPHVCVFSFTMS